LKAFIDTNVLIYWVDDSARADRVEQLLAQQSVISVQVLNEFANVLRKKRAMPVADIQTLSNTLIEVCEVHDVRVRTHQLALVLMSHYNFSLYDANIVAAAGLSGCGVLYSEDMQDGLNIKLPEFAKGSTLTLRNPFRS